MAKNEMILNGNDAWIMYGVRMGSGFVDSLMTDSDMKDYVSNSVRTEDGIRIVPIRPKIDSRTVTLEFIIIGSSHDNFLSRLRAFDALMDNGFVTIQVPSVSSDIYRLYCTRKSSSYARGNNICKKSLRFTEANPRNRGELTSAEKELYNMKEYEDL